MTDPAGAPQPPARPPTGRAAANQWIALCCAATGVWLLVIAVLYRDWPALAVALTQWVSEWRAYAATTPGRGRTQERADGVIAFDDGHAAGRRRLGYR